MKTEGWPGGRVFLKCKGEVYVTERAAQDYGGAVGLAVLAHPIDLDSAWHAHAVCAVAAVTIAVRLEDSAPLTELEAIELANELYVARVALERDIPAEVALAWLRAGCPEPWPTAPRRPRSRSGPTARIR